MFKISNIPFLRSSKLEFGTIAASQKFLTVTKIGNWTGDSKSPVHYSNSKLEDTQKKIIKNF
jgi:hypothetical protein